MIDYKGLFNCLRPDPPQGMGAFDEPGTEVYKCNYCHEKATRSVIYKMKFDDDIHQGHDFTCDLCFGIEFEEYEHKEIIRIEKL